MANKRGRPKSKGTKERERQEEMLKNLPSHIPRLTASEWNALEKQLDENDKIGAQIIKDHKSSPTVSDDHALNMASLEHELLDGYEEVVLSKEKKYRDAVKEGQRRGAEQTRQIADNAARDLCEKNSELIAKIKPNGNYSLDQVARRIREEWATLTLPRLPNEPLTLTERGVGEKRSVQTVTNWIKRIQGN